MMVIVIRLMRMVMMIMKFIKCHKDGASSVLRFSARADADYGTKGFSSSSFG